MHFDVWYNLLAVLFIFALKYVFNSNIKNQRVKSLKDNPQSYVTRDLPWVVRTRIIIRYSWSPLSSSYHDYPPSCTSSNRLLQLCKVSSVSGHSVRWSCAYKTCWQTDGQGDSNITSNTLFAGCGRYNNCLHHT